MILEMNAYFWKQMADSDRKSYLEMEIQSKSKKLKKKNKIKSDKENRHSQNKVGK